MRAKLGFSQVDIFLSEKNCVDGEYGHYIYAPRDPNGKIFIHPDQGGVALVDTVIHELFHHIERAQGLEMPHNVVHCMAAALAEMLTTAGLIKPSEFEARLRLKAKKA